ncbi:ORF386 [White spot syndrome virus]|uniref:ORF386 n=1 Tax=White spot syndrome virus TaxID=342409 RepID=A0A2D3I5S1_9VIRU|nr:ORF386 [White spot syndrome virus]
MQPITSIKSIKIKRHENLSGHFFNDNIITCNLSNNICGKTVKVERIFFNIVKSTFFYASVGLFGRISLACTAAPLASDFKASNEWYHFIHR